MFGERHTHTRTNKSFRREFGKERRRRRRKRSPSKEPFLLHQEAH
jgi:hypothetical protein